MRLLITRPRDEALALAELLTARDHTVITEPLLEIVWLPGPPVEAEGVQAILFTSANGVRALMARNADLAPLRLIPVITVGDATARAARDAGFVHIESANGDVVALAERVAAICDPARGDLLHIAGSRTAGDLAGTLSAQGFTVRREVIYEAHKASELSPATVARLRQGEIDGALFYSPRTAKAFVELIDAAGLAPTLGRVMAFCLSRAVADAADTLPGAASWRDIIVAPQPTQESLLETLDRLAPSEPAAPETAATAEPDLPTVAPPATETVPTVTAAPAAGASGGASQSHTSQANTSHARTGSNRTARIVLVAGAVLLLGGGAFAVVKSDLIRRLVTADSTSSSELGPAPQVDTPIGPAAPSSAEAEELRRAFAALEARLAEVEQRPVAPAEQQKEPAPPPAPVAAEPSPEILARLDDLERRLTEVANRPAASPEVMTRLDDLERRLIEVTNRPAASPEPSPEVMARLDDMERRLTEAANRPSVAPEALQNAAGALETRLARLEATVADLTHRLDAQAAAQAEAQNRSAQGETLALGSVLLREALARGTPFAEALPPLRAAVAEDSDLSARLEHLTPVATTGLATRETLRDRFAALADDLRRRNESQPAADGILAGVWQQIRGLVTVRRLDDDAPVDENSTPDRVVARAQSRLAAADLAGAVAAVDLLLAQPTLAPEARVAVEDWLRAARLRLDAESLLNDLLARGISVTSGTATGDMTSGGRRTQAPSSGAASPSTPSSNASPSSTGTP